MEALKSAVLPDVAVGKLGVDAGKLAVGKLAVGKVGKLSLGDETWVEDR